MTASPERGGVPVRWRVFNYNQIRLPRLMNPASTLPPQAPSADLDNQARAWFVRERAGLTPLERVEFQAWLTEAPDHAQALQRCQRQWDELDALPASGIAQLRRQLAADLAREKPPRWQRWLWRPVQATWAPFGAAALLVALTGAGGLAWHQLQQQPLYSRSFSTEKGQQLALALPDGSRIKLDTASRSEINLYRQRREVRLPEGQAMFEIARDPARPFDVWAGPLRITVLGTRFAVRYTPSTAGDGRVNVAVEEGHVRVTAAASADSTVVELIAGQQVGTDAGGRLGAVAAVPADGVAAWRDGRVSFDDAPLAQVLAEFERYGDTGLVLKDARVGALRLTGTFDPQRLDNFRRLLPQVLPVRLRERAGRTEIHAAAP